MNQKELDRRSRLYREQINGWLVRGTREDLTQLIQLYMQEEFTKEFLSTQPDLAGGWILAVISNEELAAERKDLFVRQFDCLEDFLPVWDELKFRLWELEFWGGDQALKGMLETIRERQVTDFALKNLLYTSAVDKKRMLVTICEGYLELEKNMQMALRILARGCELFPEDQEIAGTWSQLMKVMGGEQCG